MFEEDDELEGLIDTYHEPFRGQIFEQYGNVIFPSKNYNLRVENKNTRVSIFFEKRHTKRNITVFLDNKQINFIHNYVFMYNFKGIEGDGATVVQSLIDPAKAKLFNNYEKSEVAFNSLHNKLSKLNNLRLIYHGSRNEG